MQISINMQNLFTEFAIQQDVFSKYEDPTKTAEEIAKFFNTLVAKLGEDE
mgnify:CR=1 FL=1